MRALFLLPALALLLADGPAHAKPAREGAARGWLRAAPWVAEPTDQADAQFGEAVTGVGDVNGDGYGDVVIGAPQWNGQQTKEGRAYLYLGSTAGLETTPIWVADPCDQAEASFGFAVAGAGDVNGDGLDDVLVGAPDWDGIRVDQGRAYLYLGDRTTGLKAAPAWDFEGDALFGALGVAVASAGDVDGDGHPDVLIGAFMWSDAFENEGRVYLFRGTTSGLEFTPSWTANPAGQAAAQFGWSLSSAGDVNGDGYSDVVIGAPLWNEASQPNFNEGRAYLYLGGPTGLGMSPSWTVDPTDSEGAQLGSSVSGAGDVNGDGFADVLLSAPGWPDPTNSSPAEGKAFLYLGSSSGLTAQPVWTADPTDNLGAIFGNTVAGAGDVNGDGYADAIIGAPGFDGEQSLEGRTYLYLGGPNGLGAIPSWFLDPTQTASARFGISAAGAVDANADGFADLIVGALSDNGTVTGEGRAYLYLGGPPETAAPPRGVVEPADQADALVGPIASGGDLNGDGRMDVVLGAPGWNEGALVGAGRAYAYAGSTSGFGTLLTTLSPPVPQAGARFGASVAILGDVNGDGFVDVAVGAPGWDEAGTGDAGRVMVYRGGTTGLSSVPMWATSGEPRAGAELGSAIGGIDANGDGFADLLVGAPGWAGEGRAYLYLGGATGLSSTPAWVSDPADAAGARFGAALAGRGDVDGDGFEDAAVGAPGAQNEAGQIWFFMGQAGGLSTNVASSSPASAGAHFGAAIASAGDVDADGRGDLLVGAPAETSTSAEAEGRAYLFLGASHVPDRVIRRPDHERDAHFGSAVASALDVNGDGADDILIGAEGAAGQGQVQLFLGGQPIATAPSFVAASGQAGARLGAFVASGDVDGDAFADLLATSPGWDRTGRAWIFSGGSGAPGRPRHLQQLRTDGSEILPGQSTCGGCVTFTTRAIAEGPVGGPIRLELELREAGLPMDGQVTARSATVAAGQKLELKACELRPGAYRWRARLSAPMLRGRWIAFGGNSSAEVDLRVAEDGAGCRHAPGDVDAGAGGDGGRPTDAGGDAGVEPSVARRTSFLACRCTHPREGSIAAGLLCLFAFVWLRRPRA